MSLLLSSTRLAKPHNDLVASLTLPTGSVSQSFLFRPCSSTGRPSHTHSMETLDLDLQRDPRRLMAYAHETLGHVESFHFLLPALPDP
jgi:hypothetical protein